MDDVGPVKLCPLCHHNMEVDSNPNWSPERQWVCGCGHQEPLYGRAEEGEA